MPTDSGAQLWRRRPRATTNPRLFLPVFMPRLRCARAGRIAVLALVAAATGGAKPGANEVRVARTIMADAAPSSFAIGLPGGVSFCFDPVRGGISYAWTGGFADLTPAWPEVGKFIKPVKLLGKIVYRESGPSPLRRGDPDRRPTVVFKGYRLQGDGIEFHYTVDGVLVRERIRARPSGDGFVRHFTIAPNDGDVSWWYLPGALEGGELKSDKAQRVSAGFQLPAGNEREFTLEVLFSPLRQ